MPQILSSFLDRLSERLIALTASLVSARVAGMHAASQAEQQSDLEDIARRYEAEGKIEIANALRQRLLRISSPDLASEAVEVLRNVGTEPPRLTGSTAPPTAGDLKGLPDFAQTSPRSKKARRAVESSPAGGEMEARS